MHSLFFFNDTATTEIYTLSLHDALPISRCRRRGLPLLVLLLPLHGRVRLHLALPPRRDDPALQRRMRESSETVGRADVCQQAFHTPSVLGNHVASGRERGRPTRPPSSPVG